jgi:hypothetical protein
LNLLYAAAAKTIEQGSRFSLNRIWRSCVGSRTNNGTYRKTKAHHPRYNDVALSG